MAPVLQCSDLTKIYRTKAETVRALDGVSLQIESGEFIAIMGSSGSGKSTLLHLLGGLDRPTSGTLHQTGVDLAGLSDRDLTRMRRRKMGFVFQAFNLIPTLTAEENILLPLLLDGRRENRPLLEQILGELGLKERAGRVQVVTALRSE